MDDVGTVHHCDPAVLLLLDRALHYQFVEDGCGSLVVVGFLLRGFQLLL